MCNQKIVAEQCLMPLLRFPTCGNLRQIPFDLPLNEPNWQVKRGFKKNTNILINQVKINANCHAKPYRNTTQRYQLCFFLLKENKVKRKGNLITSIVLSEFFA